LNDTRLDYYEALPTMDPLIVNLRAALPEVRHLASAVDTLVALLRSYDVIDKCDLDLPRNARTGAVLRRLLRGLYAVRAPRPPFTVPEPFHLVETIGELRDLDVSSKTALPMSFFTDPITGSILQTEQPFTSSPRSLPC
jgi:hypothetical protein